MPTPIPTPYSEAKDSLARVLRAWNGKAGVLPNGNTANMDQEAVKRCVAMGTIKQLEKRVKRAGR